MAREAGAAVNPHTVPDGRIEGVVRLACTTCGKPCSTPLVALPHEIGGGLVVRAVITCPECLAHEHEHEHEHEER